jgi:hypothetical protein
MHLVDRILVGLAVLASAMVAFKSLAPRTYRSRVLALLAAWAGRASDRPVLGRLARHLASSAAAKSGGCGGCDSCGTEPKTAAASVNADVSVPVGQIGRRRRDGGV